MDQAVSHRLDRLERENRFFKAVGLVALAVIAAVVLMGQGTGSKVAKVIEAEKFVLRDAKGEKSADLAVRSDGAVMLGIGRHAKDGRITLVAGGERVPTMSFFGKDLKGSVLLGIGIEGNPFLSLSDKGKTRVRLGVLPNSQATFVLFDKAAKVIWSAP